MLLKKISGKSEKMFEEKGKFVHVLETKLLNGFCDCYICIYLNLKIASTTQYFISIKMNNG